jgi:ABC-type amino acid transport substrate-binding protein
MCKTKKDRKMKKGFRLLMITAFFSVQALAQSYVGDSWGQVKQVGKGTISLAYVETPSFVYKDKSGQLTGICIDIMQDFVTWVNENKKVKLQSKFVGDGASFQGMYQAVKKSSAGVFGLGNITITEERKREVKFSHPFITNFAILITQGNVATLAKLEDLPTTFGKLTAYTAKGSLNEKRILELKAKYFPALKIVTTSSSPEAYKKVFNDPNSFTYLDLAYYLEAVQERKSVKRHPIGDRAAEQFGFAMPLNSDWNPLMEEFFADNGGYTSTKRYREILSKHLGDTGVKLLQSAGK